MRKVGMQLLVGVVFPFTFHTLRHLLLLLLICSTFFDIHPTSYSLREFVLQYSSQALLRPGQRCEFHSVASSLLMPQSFHSWAEKCQNIYANGTPITDGLLDQNGNPMTAFNSTTTWFITREACYQHCGPSPMHEVSYIDVSCFSGIDLVLLSSEFSEHQNI